MTCSGDIHMNIGTDFFSPGGCPIHGFTCLSDSSAKGARMEFPLGHNLFSFPLFISIRLLNVYHCHSPICSHDSVHPATALLWETKKELRVKDKPVPAPSRLIAHQIWSSRRLLVSFLAAPFSPPHHLSSLFPSLFHLLYYNSRSILVHRPRGFRTTLKSHRSLTGGRLISVG